MLSLKELKHLKKRTRSGTEIDPALAELVLDAALELHQVNETLYDRLDALEKEKARLIATRRAIEREVLLA